MRTRWSGKNQNNFWRNKNSTSDDRIDDQADPVPDGDDLLQPDLVLAVGRHSDTIPKGSTTNDAKKIILKSFDPLVSSPFSIFVIYLSLVHVLSSKNGVNSYFYDQWKRKKLANSGILKWNIVILLRTAKLNVINLRGKKFLSRRSFSYKVLLILLFKMNEVKCC